MRKSKFSSDEIFKIFDEASSTSIRYVCKKYNISRSTFYRWKKNYSFTEDNFMFEASIKTLGKKLSFLEGKEKFSDLKDEEIVKFLLILIHLISDIISTIFPSIKIDTAIKENEIKLIIPMVKEIFSRLENSKNLEDIKSVFSILITPQIITEIKEKFTNPLIPKGSFKYFNAIKKLVKNASNTNEKFKKMLSISNENLTFENMLFSIQNINTIEVIQAGTFREKIDNINNLYKKLSSIYEKQIKLIIVLIEISENKDKINYSKLQNSNLTKNIKRINETEYSILGTLDTTIRNAIAHDNIMIYENEEQVFYKDGKKNIKYSYNQILNKFEDLYFSVMALLNTYNYILYIIFSKTNFFQN